MHGKNCIINNNNNIIGIEWAEEDERKRIHITTVAFYICELSTTATTTTLCLPYNHVECGTNKFELHTTIGLNMTVRK